MPDEERRRFERQRMSSSDPLVEELRRLELERQRMSHHPLLEMTPQQAEHYANGLGRSFVRAIESFNLKYPDEDAHKVDYIRLHQAFVAKTLRVLFRQGRIFNPESRGIDEALDEDKDE